MPYDEKLTRPHAHALTAPVTAPQVVLERMKRSVFQGVVLSFSGVFPVSVRPTSYGQRGRRRLGAGPYRDTG